MMVFYVITHDQSITQEPSSLPPNIAIEVWHPKLFNLKPSGLPLFPYVIWWLFHYAHIFSNKEYGLVIMRQDSKIVHCSLITPRYFRFINMGDKDLQVGATFTHPDWRGRGLAKSAIRIIRNEWKGRFDNLWYITEIDNPASIRVAKSCGFLPVGQGVREKKYGIGLLAQYKITARIQHSSKPNAANR